MRCILVKEVASFRGLGQLMGMARKKKKQCVLKLQTMRKIQEECKTTTVVYSRETVSLTSKYSKL